MEERKQVLSRFELFAGLDDRQLGEVARIARRYARQSGEMLFHKGDEGVDICLVVRGRLKAYVTSPDGQDRVFRQMSNGDVIGELAVFARGKRTANVTALEDCDLLMISRRDLFPLLSSCPEIAIRLLGVIAERTIELSEALADANFRPVSERLAKSLLRFADRWGQPAGGGGTQIGVRLSQSELGEIIGATRESVNKTLKKWTKRQVIAMQDRSITILDREALTSLSERIDGVDSKIKPITSEPAARSRAETSAKPSPGKARPAARRKSAPK
jgi:CRP/FNR family cyclic AMP-dependent transcriptional regulator